TQADLPIRKDLPVPDFADRPFILFIPSLQERIEDIPLLANLFLDRFRCEYGKKIIGFSKEAMKTLLAYSYPGNVLELENAVERAVILCQGVEITPASLPPNFLRKQHHVEPDSLVTMAELEKQHIRNVLLHTGGNKNEAAEILDISRTSLWRKLKQMGES
ncbi:MAG: helix-turn-helix domain-containing protein, partial [Desulfovibrionales bacterium]